MRVVRLLVLALLAVAVVSAQTDTSSPLFAAIERGSTKAVERLLKAGASANAIDADGVPALMTATLFANADMLELLLARGADPNRTGPSGATALMWASPDIEKMRRLIDHGANVNARSEADRTALLSRPRTRERSARFNCCSITAPTFALRIAADRRRSPSRFAPAASTSCNGWSGKDW